MQLFNNPATRKLTNLLNKKTPEEQSEILNGLEEEMKKLSKKQKKKAEKLLVMFNKGQVLVANKDIDNKKVILDNE